MKNKEIQISEIWNDEKKSSLKEFITTHSQKQETLEEAAERILANDIDGLKELLNDDEMFYFYKGVIQCYGEAMAEWQLNQTKKMEKL